MYMRRLIDAILVTILVTLVVMLVTCRTVPERRTEPRYKGVDPRVQSLVNQYKVLGASNGLFFTRDVTIGFTNIGKGPVIGVCYYGNKFREIDVDQYFWDNSTDLSRKAMLFHELTHCYCGRDHDYGFMKYYHAVLRLRMGTFMNKAKPGFMDDGCPLSIMNPYILDDYCMNIHYDSYIKEMFERCAPW
jgi:hypothetical protein